MAHAEFAEDNLIAFRQKPTDFHIFPLAQLQTSVKMH